MSVMLVHTLVIERATAGSVDEYNQPAQTYSTLATVQGLVQPKSALEQARLNQAGVVASDYSVYLPLGTDVREADRVVYGGETYQIDGIERRPYGSLAHLKVSARKVTA